LEDVLLLDSPHVIKSCVDLALRNAGFGRYLRPGKSTAMAVSEAAVS
jgi:phosphotransferase system enzyme I (PtsP)